MSHLPNALAGVLLACVGLHAAAEPVKTERGYVDGIEEGSVRVYKAIPFAAPPVGELRWRPPQPAPAWKGARMAAAFPPMCPHARRGPRGGAGDLPPPRHADGRAGQLRRGQPRHRPGRDVRGPPSRGGNGRPGVSVHRRHRLRAGGAPVPAGRGDLLPGLLRRQRRRVRHRHAAVVGVRRGDEAGRAVHGIDREPAQVRPHRPPRGPHHAGADRGRGPVRGGRAPGRGPRQEGGYPAGHQAGPVRAGRHNRRR